MSTFQIRTYGDPVLKQLATPVTDVDGAVIKLVDDMVETMYDAIGAGLAAPQIGVQKRIFTFDVGEGPEVLINPEIVESEGELFHDEACLSIPGLRIGILRPSVVHIRGLDVDGNDVEIEADDFLGRVFQHEIDHLDGILMTDRLDDDTHKQVKRILRDRAMGLDTTELEAKLVVAGSDQEI